MILVALAAGHLVETMNAEKMAEAAAAAAAKKPKGIERVSAGPDAVAVPKAVAAAAETAPALPPPAAIADASEPAAPVLTVVEPAAPAPAMDAPVLAALPEISALPEPMAEPAATAEFCTPTMTLAAGPQATISVSLAAPCRAGERVVLRHAGLAFAEKLDAGGSLHLDLPALDKDGVVSVLFADAGVLRDAVAVPEAAIAHRFAVQWMADDTFQLHAFEKGAGYGQPGDVWSGAPVSPDGGYLVSLGDPGLDIPMLAEVYTFPTDIPADLTIEATVTETTCGRELLGETLVTGLDGVVKTDLTLAMPDCTALGDILVLKNPGLDVTLATAN